MNRRIVFIVCFFSTVCISLFAQNAAPKIQNAKAHIDAVKKQVVIQYDLKDMENDVITVGLKVLDRRRNFLRINSGDVSGNIGGDIKSGKQKTIVWTYSDTIKQIRDYQIKLYAYDSHKIDINEIVSRVSKQNLINEINEIYGARSHNPGENLQRLHEVQDYMSQTFRKHGLNTLVQMGMVKEKKIKNVIGELEGFDETICYILCAHYDTEPVSPGADDNGSGVIGMLESMRVLSNYHFSKSIRFIGMDGEEIGHLGSRIYVKRALADSFRKIEGVINFDMIGYYSDKPRSQSLPYGYEMLYPEAVKKIVKNKLRGDFILNVASETSAELGKTFDDCARKYVSDLMIISLVAEGDYRFTKELNNSDHLQFWKGGYKALLVSDTGPYRNKRLDTKKDLLKTLDFDFIEKVVKATVASLAELAEVKNGSSVIVDISLN